MEYRNLPNPETLQGREQRKCQKKPLRHSWHRIVLQLQDQPVPEFPILQREKTQDYPLNLTAWHPVTSAACISVLHTPFFSPTHTPFTPLIFSTSTHQLTQNVEETWGIWWAACCCSHWVEDAARRTRRGRQAAPAAPWLGGGVLAQQEFQGGFT